MNHEPRHPRINADPKIMFGKPVIRGTRIPVEQILRELGSGASNEDILEAHPHITEADILAVLDYASDVIRQSWQLSRLVSVHEPTDAIPSG